MNNEDLKTELQSLFSRLTQTGTVWDAELKTAFFIFCELCLIDDKEEQVSETLFKVKNQ